jgi:hypothetical protein
MGEVQQDDWIPVAQAAKEFGRSRQAIDLLIKKGELECKPIGPKAVKHVKRSTLLLRYASQVKQSFTPQVAQPSLNRMSEVHHEEFTLRQLLADTASLHTEVKYLKEDRQDKSLEIQRLREIIKGQESEIIRLRAQLEAERRPPTAEKGFLSKVTNTMGRFISQR